ncbi:hypothetical protein RSOLAG22IIIB_06190 [Rhizoctonia solani]|uniref:Uncharacterized protein n=1 Tax=Rhizoctonia solani TaxID=456999 RepID=A0A0K6GD20_9AGAM|nr:hypothetical protein RSOLAG22IIIB_06190 [Rhizoctonia solani]
MAMTMPINMGPMNMAMAPPPPPPQQQLSACVTRILSLSGFPQSLKTRDVQQAFAEYDQERGGFRIKWVDDTSLLLVFNDATVAKKAYLNTLLSPPAALLSPTSATRIQIKPYDGPEAQSIIQAVQQRAHGHGHSGSVAYKGHASRASFSGGAMGSFGAGTSVPRPNNATGPGPSTGSLGRSSGASMWSTTTAKPSATGNSSPTLPNLPSHPTLNSLISSASPQLSSGELAEEGSGGEERGGPRIGEPGKRMVAAGLGVRRPSASAGAGVNKGSGGADKALSEVQKALGGVSIAE